MPGLVGKDTSHIFGRSKPKDAMKAAPPPPSIDLKGAREMPLEYSNIQTVIIFNSSIVAGGMSSTRPETLSYRAGNNEQLIHAKGLTSATTSESHCLGESPSSSGNHSGNSSSGLDDSLSFTDSHCEQKTEECSLDGSPSDSLGDVGSCVNYVIKTEQRRRHSPTVEAFLSDSVIEDNNNNDEHTDNVGGSPAMFDEVCNNLSVTTSRNDEHTGNVGGSPAMFDQVCSVTTNPVIDSSDRVCHIKLEQNGGCQQNRDVISSNECESTVTECEHSGINQVRLQLLETEHKPFMCPTPSKQISEENGSSNLSVDSGREISCVSEVVGSANTIQFSDNSSQRQRSLEPESSESKHLVMKSKSSHLLRKSRSYPNMTQRALFIPIRPSPEQSGLFLPSELKVATHQQKYRCTQETASGIELNIGQSSLDNGGNRQVKQQQTSLPVARVNPQTNASASHAQQHSLRAQQQQQFRAQQVQHTYCQQLCATSAGYLMQDSTGCYQQTFVPVIFVPGPGGGYYIPQDYLQEPPVATSQESDTVIQTQSSIPLSENQNRPTSHHRNKQEKAHNLYSQSETQQSMSYFDPSIKSTSYQAPYKSSKWNVCQNTDSNLPQTTPSDRDHRHNTCQSLVQRKRKTPLLPDPLIPKFSDMISMATASDQSSSPLESRHSFHENHNQPYYLHPFNNNPSVFQVNPVTSSVFLHQVPYSSSNCPPGGVVTSPPQQSMFNLSHQGSNINKTTSNLNNSVSPIPDFVTDQTGLVIYGLQQPSNETVLSLPQSSPSSSLVSATKLPNTHIAVQNDQNPHVADATQNDNNQPTENVHGQPYSGGIIYIPDGSGSYIAVEASSVQTQMDSVTYQPGYHQGEPRPYMFTTPALSAAGDSSQDTQTLSSSMDNSPATVRMVSSNGPPVPMPMQVPPGHMVQQIVDEHGILTHVILSPQPTGPTGHMTVGPYGGPPTSGSQYYTSYGAPHYAPTPPQYTHRPHPHSLPPYVHGGMPHIQTPTSPTCSNHTSAQSQGEYGASPPLNSREDRTMRTRNRVRKKLQQRRVNINDGFYPNTRQPGPRRNRVNGDINMHGETVLIHGQCNAPENGPLDAEEENTLITQCLSSMPAPKVTDVEARISLIQLSPPDCDCSEVDLDPYEIRYELLLSDKGRDAKYKTVFCGDASEITLKDLKPATEYHLKVRALLSEELKGALIGPVSFQTLQCEPEPPQPPKLMTKTKTSISLKWNATCENGSSITAYSLECDQGQGDGRFYEVYSGVQRQFRVVHLNASTRYIFRLAAINGFGKSPFSEEVSFFTSGTVPSQPDPPMLSEQFVYALTISWIRHPNEDEFLLQMEDESTGHGFITVYNGSNLSTVIRNLRRNTEYRFRLCAKNEEGQSKWSEIVCYKTQPERPQPPSKPQIKGKINPYSFRVTWDPPQDTGGSDVSKYIVELDNGQGYDTVYEGSEREHLFDHLIPGTVYHIRVACCNAGGRSDFSGSCVATTLPVTPGQCQAPKLQGKPKATSLHLKWSYPDYDGGAQVTHFSAQMISPDNTTRDVYKGHDQDCIVAGLLPGRPYLFQARAFNRAGAGPWSEPLEVVSGPGVPDGPKAPHVICRSAHSVLVTWEEPINNGANITEYRLEWQQRSETSEFSLLYTGPNISYEAKGLTPATAYTFRVQAINSAGPSPFSLTTPCVTPASSPSSIVTIKVKVNATSALVTWREPNCNGSDITSYNIAVNDKPPITLDPVSEYLLEDLVPETTYKIRVQAMNTIGVGAYSSAVKFATKALPPCPPRLECVLLAPCSIKLKWGEGRNLDHLTYTLEMEKEDGSFQPVYTGPAHTHKVTRLTELTSYEFRIYASNDAGSGPYSDTYTFTTTKAPPPPLKAPRVLNLTLHGCLVEWQGVKPMGEDTMTYILQLLCVNARDSEYKQIYKGPNTQFQLDSLLPKMEYQARVAAVRLSSDSSEGITGAFSPGVIFSPETPEPQRLASNPSFGQEERTKERKPWSDQQYAAMILCMFVLLAIISAFLCQQLISYMSSPEDPTSSSLPAPVSSPTVAAED